MSLCHYFLALATRKNIRDGPCKSKRTVAHNARSYHTVGSPGRPCFALQPLVVVAISRVHTIAPDLSATSSRLPALTVSMCIDSFHAAVPNGLRSEVRAFLLTTKPDVPSQGHIKHLEAFRTKESQCFGGNPDYIIRPCGPFNSPLWGKAELSNICHHRSHQRRSARPKI